MHYHSKGHAHSTQGRDYLAILAKSKLSNSTLLTPLLGSIDNGLIPFYCFSYVLLL